VNAHGSRDARTGSWPCGLTRLGYWSGARPLMAGGDWLRGSSRSESRAAWSGSCIRRGYRPRSCPSLDGRNTGSCAFGNCRLTTASGLSPAIGNGRGTSLAPGPQATSRRPRTASRSSPRSEAQMPTLTRLDGVSARLASRRAPSASRTLGKRSRGAEVAVFYGVQWRDFDVGAAVGGLDDVAVADVDGVVADAVDGSVVGPEDEVARLQVADVGVLIVQLGCIG